MESNRKDLIQQLKNLGINGCSRKNKADLIKLLELHKHKNVNEDLNITLSKVKSSNNNINKSTIDKPTVNKSTVDKPTIDIDIDKDKLEIIERFYNNVKGFDICLDNQNKNHCGKEGHWLETQMGIKHNSKNDPDINGYEMKNDTKQVTTFIDKQTTYKMYEGEKFKNSDIEIKTKFWNTFARQNSDGIKIGGWKLNTWDIDGQSIEVDENNNINIKYNYKHDTRKDKKNRVSTYYKNNEEHIIGTWIKEDLEQYINNKFNNKGIIICKKINNKYEKICFGNPISFDVWIQKFKEKVIYYDGYSSLNNRWRGCFRANNKFWNELITEEY